MLARQAIGSKRESLLKRMNEPNSQRRFLVADDAEDMRWIVKRLIRQSCPVAVIHEAPDVQTALLALADAGEGDGLTVVSDYHMGPGANGGDLLAEVARRHPRARRVLFTGDGSISAGAKISCADRVFSKDVGMKDLRAYLGEA